MKVISQFDKCVTEVLADKVKARLTFKVAVYEIHGCRLIADYIKPSRVTWTLIAFAMKSGPSSSKKSTSSLTIPIQFMQTESRSSAAMRRDLVSSEVGSRLKEWVGKRQKLFA